MFKLQAQKARSANFALSKGSAVLQYTGINKEAAGLVVGPLHCNLIRERRQRDVDGPPLVGQQAAWVKITHAVIADAAICHR